MSYVRVLINMVLDQSFSGEDDVSMFCKPD
jgi:hypothetical protein